MWEFSGPWPEVLDRLGVRPTQAIEDGLLYAHHAVTHTVELHVRTGRAPPAVRVVIRPVTVGAPFLVVARRSAPSAPEATTGDPDFDEVVAILRGAEVVMHRLGPSQRLALRALMGLHGATLAADQATLEPSATAAFESADRAVAAIHDLTAVALGLADDPPLGTLLERWWRPDPAEAVMQALHTWIEQALPDLDEAQAEQACRVLVERGVPDPVRRLLAMPPHPVVLRTWFRVGDALDPRVTERVLEAFDRGAARPAARYLAWLLGRADDLDGAALVIERLWRAPGLAQNPELGRELVRALRHRPPAAARPILQQIRPRSTALARRLAAILADYQHPEADVSLIAWLSMPGSGVRRAAADALAGRVLAELRAGRPQRVTAVAEAARGSGSLVTALVALIPKEHSRWLSELRPHGEPDAIMLIRRLGEGGANVDDALLYWLDRGTRSVQLAAASALATAGTPRAVYPLRERGTGWFGDGVVREQCRLASDAILRRSGGRGTLALADHGSGALTEVAATGGLARIDE